MIIALGALKNTCELIGYREFVHDFDVAENREGLRECPFKSHRNWAWASNLKGRGVFEL